MDTPADSNQASSAPSQTDPQPQVAASTKHSGSAVIITVIVIIILLVVGFFGYKAYKHAKSSETASNAISSTQAVPSPSASTEKVTTSNADAVLGQTDAQMQQAINNVDQDLQQSQTDTTQDNPNSL